MPIALSLLFVVVPIAAALSLEIDSFAVFFIVFCVIAGLSVADESMNASAEEGPQARRPAKPGTRASHRAAMRQAAFHAKRADI